MPKNSKGDTGKDEIYFLFQSLVTDLGSLVTLTTELRTDHATTKTLVDELKADFNLLRAQARTMCFGPAGLAEGTNANTIQIATAINYSIGGVAYVKAITDNVAMTALALQAISTYVKYLVSIDSSGTVTLTKGTEVATDASVLPATPASECAIGYFNVATDGATTFTSGTTDLGAAGITDTYVDFSMVNGGASNSSAIAATGPATITASAVTLTTTSE